MNWKKLAPQTKVMVVLMTVAAGLGLIIGWVGVANAPGGSRLLSAGLMLDYARRDTTGLGTFEWFFRRTGGETGVTRGGTGSVVGDGVLPDGMSREEYERIKKESRDSMHAALKPTELEKAARRYRSTTVNFGGLFDLHLDKIPAPRLGGWWPAVKNDFFPDLSKASVDRSRSLIELGLYYIWMEGQEEKNTCAGEAGVGISDSWAYNIAEVCKNNFKCDPFKQVTCARAAVDALYDSNDRSDVCLNYTIAMENVIPRLDWHGAKVSLDRIWIVPKALDNRPLGQESHILNEITITPASGPNKGKIYVYAYDGQNWPSWFMPNNKMAFNEGRLPEVYDVPDECMPAEPEIYLKLGYKTRSPESIGEQWFMVSVVDEKGKIIVAPNEILAEVRTKNGTATAGQDYVARFETFGIEAGEGWYPFKIEIIDDEIPEPGPDEYYEIELLDASVGAKPLAEHKVVQGYIYDNDSDTTSPLPSPSD